jgi:hypothetical protein
MHISIMHTQDKVVLTSSSEMISLIMKSRSPAFVNAGALGSWVTTPSREVCLVIWSVLSKSENICLPIHVGFSLRTEKCTGMWHNTDCLALFAINVDVVSGNVHA